MKTVVCNAESGSGGCSADASILGMSGSAARRYAHRIPSIMKTKNGVRLLSPIQDVSLSGDIAA